ncbi:hypothetical protein BGX23_001602 [Mortierella sp. AD031]|nr:hypothetical protein BGX23_001602 [Mortierella sp. AD031]KAG0197746.1 hypothetical protein BGX33_000358 [Mortierella sp. NVP41]
MNRTRYPPIFTSHGYQPSILMGTSPKRHASTRPRRSPQEQVSATCNTDLSTSSRPDYIPIWLNSRTRESAFTFTPSPPLPMLVPNFMIQSSTMAFMPGLGGFEPQEYHRLATPAPSESSMDTDAMDWATCPSSPMSRAVPDLGWRSSSPSPSILTAAPSVAPMSPTVNTAPISMAFRQRSMAPELPFQGRSRSIFLSDRFSGTGVNSRVQDLLHNTAVQRIRTWFQTTIEPCAMEQWGHRTLFDRMSRFAGAALDEPMDNAAAVPKECSICYQVGDIVKIISDCKHEICWKCETDLDRFQNISCPLCRGMRLTTSYKNLEDLFATTIGVYPNDYTHPLCPKAPGNLDSSRSPQYFQQDWYEEVDRKERIARIEHELSDRYLWEPSVSFLGHLASIEDHPAKQYFQLNAAHDLCFKSSAENHFAEYNDQAHLNPPTSGLVLPPHRLYIALIHFCLDMMTLPNPARFQNQRQFKAEYMVLELITLFLVPTDEFSPRRPGRIFNAAAWVDHGALILARIRQFMRAKVAQHKAESEEGETEVGVPSSPISRQILYLGTSRWGWIAQSLNILMIWIQLADSNPSMVPPVANWSHRSPLGKHETQSDAVPRPRKRPRHYRQWIR